MGTCSCGCPALVLIRTAETTKRIDEAESLFYVNIPPERLELVLVFTIE